MGYTKKQCREMKQQHLGQKFQRWKRPKGNQKEKQARSLAEQPAEKPAEKTEDVPS